MKEKIELKEIFRATPEQLYQAWLDSELHSKMTGGIATCSNKVGARFTAWNGYISGENVELIENEKIIQSWRTSEFAEADDDSVLTIELLKISESETQLTLLHTHIPEGQLQYRQGWIDHYFVPMKNFFHKT